MIKLDDEDDVANQRSVDRSARKKRIKEKPMTSQRSAGQLCWVSWGCRGDS